MRMTLTSFFSISTTIFFYSVFEHNEFTQHSNYTVVKVLDMEGLQLFSNLFNELICFQIDMLCNFKKVTGSIIVIFVMNVCYLEKGKLVLNWNITSQTS